MKRLLLWGSIVAGLLAAPAGADLVQLDNAGFETGDLDGWTAFEGSEGCIEVVTSWWDHHTGTMWTPVPGGGTYFAVLEAGAENEHVSLSQEFVGSAGEVLSFEYFWDSGENGDDPAHDGARGGVFRGSTFTKLFQYDAATDADTVWIPMSYVLPADDTYTLIFEVWNDDDNEVPSFLGVDVATTPAPAGVLLGFLGLGVAGLRLRKSV